MGVVTIVVTSLYNLDVSLSNGGFLRELFTKEISHEVEVTREEPANESEGEHVTALQHSLVVHACVLQRILHHLGDRTSDDAVGVDAHLTEVVGGLELCLVEIVLCERVGIDDDGSARLSVTILCLEGCSIHSYEHIALVARGIYLTSTDVYLETRHTSQRTLRGTDVGWVVGECGNAITHGSRYRREDISGELHAVAGVTREANNHLVELLNV